METELEDYTTVWEPSLNINKWQEIRQLDTDEISKKNQRAYENC